MIKFTVTDDTPSAPVSWYYDRHTLFVDGTFDGALQVEASPDGQTWFPVPDASLTSRGMLNLDVASAAYRVVSTGANPNLTVWVG